MGTVILALLSSIPRFHFRESLTVPPSKTHSLEGGPPQAQGPLPGPLSPSEAFCLLPATALLSYKGQLVASALIS